MKYDAVIFDLFGTLVESYSYKEYQSVLGQMASVLTVSFDDFRRLWSETTYERNTGIIPTIETNIEHICRKLGVSVDYMKIRLATEVRFDFVADTMKPRQDAIDVLSYLQSQGLKVGLISNCSPDAPLIWRDTPFAPLFDVVVFSSSAGVKKPEPRVYQLAVEQLAVEPSRCLYIGDGDSRELTGASQVGMHAVLVRVPDEDSSDVRWEDSSDAEEWDGSVISSLKEVLELVK